MKVTNKAIIEKLIEGNQGPIYNKRYELDGGKLYQSGDLIAEWVKGRLLLYRSWSNTHWRAIREIRKACEGRVACYLMVSAAHGDHALDHALMRALDWVHHILLFKHNDDAYDVLDSCRRLGDTMRPKRVIRKEDGLSREQLRNQINQDRARIVELRDKDHKKIEQANQKKAVKAVAKWKAGKKITMEEIRLLGLVQALRVISARVECAAGYSMPAEYAARIFEFRRRVLAKKKRPDFTHFSAFSRSACIRGDGSLSIGCQLIPSEQIEEVAEILKAQGHIKAQHRKMSEDLLTRY